MQATIRVSISTLLICLLLQPTSGQEVAEDSETSVPVIGEEPKTTDPVAFMTPALAAKATCDFSDSSVRELIDWLRTEKDLVVVVDENALMGINVSLAEPFSDKLVDDPIYLLLNRLRSLEIGWYYEDDVLRITSTDMADDTETTLPYNVGDLLDAGYDVDLLQDVIIATVAFDSWAENGTGDGTLNVLGDVLFVRQSARVHRHVAGLLQALRNHSRQTFVNDPTQHLSIRKKLHENVSVDFVDTPLEAAVAELSKKTKADIRLDKPALRDQRIREREPVTLKLSDRKLSTVLEALTLNLELTSILRDGVLWITTIDRAESFQKTAVYDVRDLCRDTDESLALIGAIISQAEPESWQENGTGGAEIEHAKPGVLVILQQERNHMAVLELLESYRTALRLSKPRERPQSDPNEVVTVYYRLDAAVAQDLASLLPRLIDPLSWEAPTRKDAPGEILIAASKPDLTKISSRGAVTDKKGIPAQSLVIEQAVLIVRHTRAVHDEITEIIRRVEKGDAYFQGGTGGGLGGGGGGFGGGFFSVPTEDALQPANAE